MGRAQTQLSPLNSRAKSSIVLEGYCRLAEGQATLKDDDLSLIGKLKKKKYIKDSFN